jgi:hyperosmotically inducible protein
MNINGVSAKIGATLAAVLVSASMSIAANASNAQAAADAPAAATALQVADATSRLQTRPDSALSRDVSNALRRTPHLDASGIRVRARRGIVTLTGWVPERRQISLAGNTARSVRGVRSVSNELVIRNTRRPPSPPRK